MVFAPLDVEMILADLASPTETKLLPDADPEYAAISPPRERRAARPAVPGQAGARRGPRRDGRRVRRDARSPRRERRGNRRRPRALAGAAARRPFACASAARASTCAPAPCRCGRRCSTPRRSSSRAATSRTSSASTGARASTTTRASRCAGWSRLPLDGDVPQLEPLLDVSRALRLQAPPQAARGGSLHAAGRVRRTLRSPGTTRRTASRSLQGAPLVVRTERRGALLRAQPARVRRQRLPAVPLRRGAPVFVPPVTTCEGAAGFARARARRAG